MQIASCGLDSIRRDEAGRNCTPQSSGRGKPVVLCQNSIRDSVGLLLSAPRFLHVVREVAEREFLFVRLPDLLRETEVSRAELVSSFVEARHGGVAGFGIGCML